MDSSRFVRDLLDSGGDSPPQTSEQKLSETVNALAHKMEQELTAIKDSINNINQNKVIKEEIKNEEVKHSESTEGNGQEVALQNDTKSDNAND